MKQILLIAIAMVGFSVQAEPPPPPPIVVPCVEATKKALGMKKSDPLPINFCMNAANEGVLPFYIPCVSTGTPRDNRTAGQFLKGCLEQARVQRGQVASGTRLPRTHISNLNECRAALGNTWITRVDGLIERKMRVIRTTADCDNLLSCIDQTLDQASSNGVQPDVRTLNSCTDKAPGHPGGPTHPTNLDGSARTNQ